jgi:uncharacterized protein YacL
MLFVFACVITSWLICYSIKEWDAYQGVAIGIGLMIGGLVILVDMLLKGFSLRGLSALTFGLFVGWLVAFLISKSPLLEEGDPQAIYLVRMGLYVICTYLGAVIALRGRDEFNLVIPYVKFVPQEVDVPVVVVDTSALIDGRIASICEAQFLSGALVIPQFVINELHWIGDSTDQARRNKGRKGLDTLNRLRQIGSLDIRIEESELEKNQKSEEKLIFLARSMKAKLLTTDYNMAKLAQFHGLVWLNLNDLSKALQPELISGDRLEVDLIKSGREEGQAVGYLGDGSMVVVQNAEQYIGSKVRADISSVVPSSGGRIAFSKFHSMVEAE